jgi:putative transposase
MNSLYLSLGLSKQAFHQKMDRLCVIRSYQQQLLVMIYQIRDDHPTMGVRDMYFKLNPCGIGRDAFEVFCKEEGLMSKRIKNYMRTTDSSGVIRFDNLTKNLKIVTLNQLWQSDITYFEVNKKFYYITFVLDAYSRRILGYSVSKRLTTEQTTLPALSMAIKLRNSENIKIDGVIFHSDGGGQYYAKAFLKVTRKSGIANSMCEYAWENGKAERLNGVIKNNYLKHREINSFRELIKEVDRTVSLYNQQKPHIGLQRQTPIMFEKAYICKGQQSDDEKSATELSTQSSKVTSLRAEDNNPSESNIASELKTQKVNV